MGIGKEPTIRLAEDDRSGFQRSFSARRERLSERENWERKIQEAIKMRDDIKREIEKRYTTEVTSEEGKTVTVRNRRIGEYNKILDEYIHFIEEKFIDPDVLDRDDRRNAALGKLKDYDAWNIFNLGTPRFEDNQKFDLPKEEVDTPIMRFFEIKLERLKNISEIGQDEVKG